ARTYLQFTRCHAGTTYRRAACEFATSETSSTNGLLATRTNWSAIRLTYVRESDAESACALVFSRALRAAAVCVAALCAACGRAGLRRRHFLVRARRLGRTRVR